MHFISLGSASRWNFREETNVRIMASQKHTRNRTFSVHNVRRHATVDRFGSHHSRRKMTMKPVWLAFVFVSLLSFAISFPSDHVATSTLQSKLQRKDIAEARSAFHQTTTVVQPIPKAFLPDVFVLSLSSTSRPPKGDIDRGMTKKKRKRARKSNKITVQSVDSIDKEPLPLRTIEYRRRKHEWAERYTSQEGLREAFGSNRNKWWGDLDAKTARRLYKKLLFPTALSELVLELGDEIIRPEELAPLAYEARKAAKMYARERCRVPSRVGAYLLDGFRQLVKYGRFQPNGASYEQLWVRYYDENGSYNVTNEEWDYLFNPTGDNDEAVDDDEEDILDGVDDAVTEEEIVKRTCQKIFEKSRTTNEVIDRLFLEEYEMDERANESDGRMDSGDIVDNDNSIDDGGSTENNGKKNGRGKRWRNRKNRSNRYNDILLQRITQTLERDVRKLLEPSPNDEDIDSYTREQNLSSRRMTPQEYHSLKLFAKARKRSQQQLSRNNDSDDPTGGSPSG